MIRKDETDEEEILDDRSQHSHRSNLSDDQKHNGELGDSNSGQSTSLVSESSGDESSTFVKKETRHVTFLRILVLSILFAASAAISLVVYFVTSAGEHDTFESQYHAAADKVTGKNRPWFCPLSLTRSTCH